MTNCSTLTIYNECRFSCLLIFQRERIFVRVLFNEMLTIFCFIGASYRWDTFLYKRHDRYSQPAPVDRRTFSSSIHSRHKQQFSINVWVELVGDYSLGPHVLPHRLTDNHYVMSSYMICQNYWNLYHWQWEYECGVCMMAPRHSLAALWEMF
jgi:hypothetical protein